MNDGTFRELLRVESGATREDIKRAFHQLARQNHPDLYSEEQKPLQELRMMMLNEAYTHLIGTASSGRAHLDTAPAAADDPEPEPKAPQRSVGFHKDPSYAYYKQGFKYYSRALRGIEALYESLSPQLTTFKPRMDAIKRFAVGLAQLRQAHGYFNRVLDDYPASIWSRDARMKLRRIGRFNEIYRKILANLGANPEW
jgi:hypothetical protein